MAHLVTRESLHKMINSSDAEKNMHRIGRALVILFDRQTNTEQTRNVTDTDNMRGFTSADAFSGSVTAKYYKKHGKLLEWQVEKWTRVNKTGVSRLAKYWLQIDEHAHTLKRKRDVEKREEAKIWEMDGSSVQQLENSAAQDAQDIADQVTNHSN